MSERDIDYIIIGQGIAGTILSYSLLKEKKQILIIDEPSLSSCSKIAAGSFNPIVFKKFAKSFKADEIIPFLEDFYKDAEKFLGISFFMKKQMIKLFTEDQEKILWMKKVNSEEGKYLSAEIKTDFHNDILNNVNGCAIVNNAGNVQTAKFIEGFKNYFKKEKILLEEIFEYDALKIFDSQVNYKNIRAKRIIFCDGWKVMKNPYFSYLPFRPAKGELLKIKIPDFSTDKIIHKGISLLPIGDNLFIAGSTFNWNDLTDIPSEKGKGELIEKLDKLLKVPYEIVDHLAGVRPSVKDLRPIIGLHLKYQSIGIFNGMGTKGIMLAPYYANQFINFLEQNIPLDKEVNINRFLKDLPEN